MPPGKYRYDITRFAVIKISRFLLQNSFLSSFQASPLFYFTSPNACAPNPQSNLYPLVIEILEFSLKAFHFSFFKSVSLEHFPATIDNLLRKIFHFFLRFWNAFSFDEAITVWVLVLEITAAFFFSLFTFNVLKGC